MNSSPQNRRKLDEAAQFPIVTAEFRYIQDSPKFETEKPYHFSGPLSPDEEYRRTNLELEWRYGIPVRNVRGHTETLDLDNHGFKIVQSMSNLLENLQEKDILAKYMEETVGLVKCELNADRAICFDYRVSQASATAVFGHSLDQFRKSRPPSQPYVEIKGNGSWDLPNEPAWQVHVGEYVMHRMGGSVSAL
jgi:hypothetical protein